MPGARLSRFRTAFLDRDGTINVKAEEGDYVRSPEAVELLPGAAEAVRRLNEARIGTVVVTNQRGVARGLMTEADLDAVNRRVAELLATSGAHIDAWYSCTHAADACACRKPLPGMLLRAAEELELDLADAVLVGDSAADVGAARSAGVVAVRLGDADADADLVVPDLRTAAAWIAG